MSNENAFYVDASRARAKGALVMDLISLAPVAIGTLEQPIDQSECGIAIGDHAGFFHQGECAIAIGRDAGTTYQGTHGIALGVQAGSFYQQTEAVALGFQAGYISQGQSAVAIGVEAGQNAQRSHAVAIGTEAGSESQGGYAVAIGYRAGVTQQSANSIVLNATGVGLNAATSGLFVAPVRPGGSGLVLYYNSVTDEVLTGPVPAGNVPPGFYTGDYLHWDFGLGNWTVGKTQISLGSFAANTNQALTGVAVGFHAGEVNQQDCAVALGVYAGQTNQSNNAIAIGCEAGRSGQGISAVAIGANAGSTGQLSAALALGLQAGQSNQGTNGIAIGFQAGQLSQRQGAVAISTLAGMSGQQTRAIAIGFQAGQITQGQSAIALGANAGSTGQLSAALALGLQAGQSNQGTNGIAIGVQAGQIAQSFNAIAIGNNAGQTFQGTNAVAIGVQAGSTGQGSFAIAIGFQAGMTQQAEKSIVLNASGTSFAASQTSALYVNPIRNSTGPKALFYEPASKEITYSDPTFNNATLQTYTYSYFQARDAVLGKFMLTDCADKDAFYRLRVSEPSTLFEGSTIYDANSIYFDNDLTANASIAGPGTNAAMTLTVNAGVTQNEYAARQSHFYAHYQPGKSFLAMFSFSFGAAVAGITKRVGFYDVDNSNANLPNNGVLLEQTSSGLAWYLYKGDGTSQSAAQAAWNVDPLNGSGPSGYNLTPTAATQNLLGFVDLEWLGVGRVRVGFFLNGVPVICNVFNNAGFSVPYLNNPLLPIRFEVRRAISGATASGTLNAICCSIMSEGGFDPIGVVRTFQSNQLTLSSTEIKSALAIRLKNTFPGNAYPRAIISPISLEMVSNLTGGANIAYYSIYLWRPSSSTIPTGATWNPVSGTLGGSGSFVESSATDLYTQMTTDTTAVRILIQRGAVNSTSKTSLSAVSNALLIAQSSVDRTNRDIYLVVVDNNSTGNNNNYTALFTWREI